MSNANEACGGRGGGGRGGIHLLNERVEGTFCSRGGQPGLDLGLGLWLGLGLGLVEAASQAWT